MESICSMNECLASKTTAVNEMSCTSGIAHSQVILIYLHKRFTRGGYILKEELKKISFNERD